MENFSNLSLKAAITKLASDEIVSLLLIYCMSPSTACSAWAVLAALISVAEQFSESSSNWSAFNSSSSLSSGCLQVNSLFLILENFTRLLHFA